MRQGFVRVSARGGEGSPVGGRPASVEAASFRKSLPAFFLPSPLGGEGGSEQSEEPGEGDSAAMRTFPLTRFGPRFARSSPPSPPRGEGKCIRVRGNEDWGAAW